MVTYAELRSEQVYLDEFVPANLRRLVEHLESYYDAAVTNIGARGDNRHLKGYHRSRAWIQRSRYATNRSYSVTETTGNRHGGDENWVSAVDIIVGYTRSQQIWTRCNAAKQNGLLSYVREILLERDPWHVHLSIDRASANSDLTDLFVIITGQPYVGRRVVKFEVEMPVLGQGAEGADVLTLQSLLGARGFATQVDGEFGRHTDEQTRAMQARYGAESVDGIWGRETWTIGMTGEDRL